MELIVARVLIALTIMGFVLWMMMSTENGDEFKASWWAKAAVGMVACLFAGGYVLAPLMELL